MHFLRCEAKKNKRNFILNTVFRANNACLFTDVTQMSTGKRKCARHDSACAVPQADLLIAGTSCTGASKLNMRWKELQTAVAERRKDVQTVVTFMGFMETLNLCSARYGILENVTSLGDVEGKQSDNLSEILQLLKEAGWEAHVTKLRTADFFLPQNRERLYIFLVKSNFLEEKGCDMQQFVQTLEGNLQVCSSNNDPLDIRDLLEPDDSPHVIAELERLQGEKADKETGDDGVRKARGKAGKWVMDHMDLCERLGISWPPAPPPDMAKSEWYKAGMRLQHHFKQHHTTATVNQSKTNTKVTFIYLSIYLSISICIYIIYLFISNLYVNL